MKSDIQPTITCPGSTNSAVSANGGERGGEGGEGERETAEDAARKVAAAIPG